MQDQEIADADGFKVGMGVEFVDIRLVEAGVREKRAEPRDGSLDQVDAGGFQGFHEAAGQADCHHVAVPRLVALAGDEAQGAGLRQRLAIQVAHQDPGGLVLAHEAAAEHVAVADPVLQRDPPLPAGWTCGGARVGRDAVLGVGARHGDRAVARQPVGPVLVSGSQCLLDQQPAEAGAVDKQLAAQHGAILKGDRFNEAVFAAQCVVADLALDAAHATRLRISTQETGIQPGVEMVGVGDVGQRRVGVVTHRRHELVAQGGNGVDGVVVQRAGLSGLQQLQPVLVERHHAAILSDLAETVEIGRALALPVHEVDAQLESALGAADKIGFVQFQRLVVELDHRDGAFAHADSADFLGLHQGDGVVAVQHLRQRGGGHPASGTAADDHDFGNTGIAHVD